jgi:carnitine O-acetyltransferase
VSYLTDVYKMILHIYRQANERPAPFVDHTGILRDSRTGEPITPVVGPNDEDDEDEDLSKSTNSVDNKNANSGIAGYSFFDAGGVEALNRERIRAPYGRRLLISKASSKPSLQVNSFVLLNTKLARPV